MRRIRSLVALLGTVACALFVLAPAASAQTDGYPPGPCTAVVGSQDVGTVTVGQHFTLQLAPVCVFTAGASVTVTVNGVSIPGKVANANGFVLVDITVVSATELSVDDPTTAPAVCGVNTVTASGPSSTAQGGVSSQTANFTLTCPATGTGSGAGTGAGAGTGGVPSATAATPIQARLSLTGANVARTVALALALMVAGSLAVVTSRRRRTA